MKKMSGSQHPRHGDLTRLWHRSNGSYLPKFSIPPRPAPETGGIQQIPPVSLTSKIYDTETRLMPVVSQVKRVPKLKFYEHRSIARPLDLLQQAVLSFHDLYAQFPDVLFISGSRMNDFKMEVEIMYEEVFTGHFYLARGFKTIEMFPVFTERELPEILRMTVKDITRDSVIAVAE